MPHPPATQSGHRTSRRHARQRLQGVATPFGQVLDLSESGACVFRKGDCPVGVGQVIQLHIVDGSFELQLEARVARTQSLGLRRTEIGAEFVQLSDQDRQSLAQLIAQASSDLSPRAWLAA